MATKVHVQDAAGNGYHLMDVDGVYFPEYFCEDPVARLNEIRNMAGRDDDVLIAAYPKAGTHWVWEMTNMLLRGSAEYHPSVKEEQMIELKGATAADQLSSPRVFNTHLRFRQLPKDMIKRNCKIIVINRNPKDMAVSRYYHVCHGDTGYKGTFSDYLPMYIKGEVAFGSWFDYTQEWDKAIEDNKGYPIHCLTYEELKREPVSVVQKLAKFLGANSDEAFVSEICEKCSFTNLKSSYLSKQKDALDPSTYAFRKGTTGDWKNWFTVAMDEQFDAAIQDNLKAHKHTFIYE